MNVLEEFAQEFANRMFELMPDFDRFDGVLHRLQRLLELMMKDDVKYVMQYYDLVELHMKIKHYINELSFIDKRLERLLE